MDARAYERLYPREAYEKTLASGARGDGRPLGRPRAKSCACGTACMLMSVPKQSKASLKVATS